MSPFVASFGRITSRDAAEMIPRFEEEVQSVEAPPGGLLDQQDLLLTPFRGGDTQYVKWWVD